MISYNAQRKCRQLTEWTSEVGEGDFGILSSNHPYDANSSPSPSLLSSLGYSIVFEACKLVYERIGAFCRKDIVAEIESHKEWDWKGDDPTIRRYVGGLASEGYLIRLGRDKYIIGGRE